MSDKANVDYCPDFTKNFKILCYTFTSWTNVMMDHFCCDNNVATSTRSETNFKNLKRRIPYTISIMKFLLKELKRNKALTNFAFMHLPKKDVNNNEKKMDSLLDLNLKDLQVSLDTNKNDLVDFKSQATDKKVSIAERSVSNNKSLEFDQEYNLQDPISNNETILSLERTLNETHNFSNSYSTEYNNISASSPTRIENISILKNRNLLLNGLRFLQKIYNINNSLLSLKFTNTCPFDSIFQIIVTAFVQNIYFMVDVKQNISNNVFLSTVVYYESMFYTTDLIYEKRAKFLYPIL